MIDTLPHFILASGSPRRKELLKAAGLSFDVIRIDIDETYPVDLSPTETVDYLAKKKLNACQEFLTEKMVITADTLVFKDELILGKPANKPEAVEMLEQLSGNAHTVRTSVCLGYQKNFHQFNVSTKVFFNNLESSEIEYYVDNFKPYDKAGAYGIQEWIGHVGISKIEGSYTNVVGMPVYETYYAVKKCMTEWLIQS